MDQAERERQRLTDRVTQILGRKPYGKIEILTDTTAQMEIYRGHVVRLEEREFFVLGDVFEPRFGLEDQPKYWVKKTRDLGDGELRLLKLVFYEEFMAHVGPIRIRCFRSPRKESQVLELVRGDRRFMQGETLHDGVGNKVRVIDFIHGQTLYDYLSDLKIDHEVYYHQHLKKIMDKLIPCMDAITFLHENDLCHGDIRNDHIILDNDSGLYRWIDFDLSQHYPDFDVWSLGNILQFVIGNGTISFHEVNESDKFSDSIKKSLAKSDAAAFFQYRIMNLRKVYPYVSEKLNKILMNFSLGTQTFYESVDHLMEDVKEAAQEIPG